MEINLVIRAIDISRVKEMLKTTKEIKDNLRKIEREANNTLYFSDNSDYESALWQILFLIDKEYRSKEKDELRYIED